MEKKGTPRADIIIGLLFAALSLVALEEALRMPRFDEVYTAPGLFPAFLSLGILLMSLGLAYSGWLRSKQAKAAAQSAPSAEAAASAATQTKRLFLVIGIILLYIAVLLGRLNYALATFIFLTAIMFVFKATQWYKILFISAVTSVAVAYAFGKIFFIPLP